MKIKQFIIILVTICTPVFSVADCYTSLRQKAIDAYNRAEYDRAIATFQSAKEDCPDTPSNHDIDSWIKKCNASKKKQATAKQTSPKPVEGVPVVEAPTPALLPDNCFFEVKEILISTNVVSECLSIVQNYNNQILSMCDVYAEKLVDYTHNASSWSSAVADFRREEIIEMRSRIFMFREAAVADVANCNNKPDDPIITLQGMVWHKGRFLKGVTIRESSQYKETQTDKNGMFTITTKKSADLLIVHKGYESIVVDVKNVQFNGGVIELNKAK